MVFERCSIHKGELKKQNYNEGNWTPTKMIWTPKNCYGVERNIFFLIFLGVHVSFVDCVIEGSLNSKLPTIWRVEKQMKSR